MSELPKGWTQVPLGDLGEWRGGGTPSKGNINFWTNGTIPWVSPKDMKQEFVGDAEDYITENAVANSTAQEIPVDSVLVVTRSGILKHSLPVAVTTKRVTINQDLKAITPFEGVFAEYLMRYLQADAQTILGDCTKAGTTVDSIDFDRLKRYPVKVAPLREQRRIVAKIASVTARSMRARSGLARIPALMAKYRETILTQAFTGRLLSDWRGRRRESPAAIVPVAERISEERRSIRAQKGLRNEGRNRSRPAANIKLVALPQSWVWLTFDECSWDMTVGHVGPMKDRYIESGIPFLRSMNVRANRVDLSNVAYIDEAFHKELRKSEIRAGELLVVRTGAPGTAAVVPEDLGVANCSDLVIARLVPSLNPHFAAFYMNSLFAREAVRGMQVGVAQQHFNVSSMREMPVPVPSFEEQAEIVRRIETAFAWLERVSADHASASKLLPKLGAAILAKAFRGELAHQDANDEPAEALLARIRGARVAEGKKPRQRATRDTAMNRDPRELLLRDSEGWPAKGLPFEEIAKRVSLPYDEMREALFALLGDEAPKMRQVFDKDAGCMHLRRVS